MRPTRTARAGVGHRTRPRRRYVTIGFAVRVHDGKPRPGSTADVNLYAIVQLIDSPVAEAGPGLHRKKPITAWVESVRNTHRSAGVGIFVRGDHYWYRGLN